MFRSGLFLLLADDLGDGLALLFQPFSAFEIILAHLFQVLFEENFPLLTVLCLFPLSKDLKDVLLKQVRVWITHIDKLESVFDGDFVPAGQVVHEELDKVEEVPRLKASLVENAALIHQCELILVHLSVKVFVYFPNPLIDLWFAVGET